MASTGPGQTRILLWDLPVRLCHWSFVLLMPAMWWTAEEHDMERHKQLGMVFLAVLAFRILWGFLGSDTARFARFVKGPGAILAYLRGQGGSLPGHNPLGALSVVALLSLLAVQIGLGLVAQDVDGIESGPLNYLVSYDTADAAREWHELIFNIILAFVIVHVGAILFYLFAKRDNLIRPMVTGRKDVADNVAQPRTGSAIALIVCLAAALALSWWIWVGAPLPG